MRNAMRAFPRGSFGCMVGQTCRAVCWGPESMRQQVSIAETGRMAVAPVAAFCPRFLHGRTILGAL